jgi:hypothetical protein
VDLVTLHPGSTTNPQQKEAIGFGLT